MEMRTAAGEKQLVDIMMSKETHPFATANGTDITPQQGRKPRILTMAVASILMLLSFTSVLQSQEHTGTQAKTTIYRVSPVDALSLLIVPEPFPSWNSGSEPAMGAFEISVDASGKTVEVRPFATSAPEQVSALYTLAKEFAFHPMSYNGSEVPFLSVLAVCSHPELGTFPCAPRLNGQGGVSDPVPQRIRLPGCEDPKGWSTCTLAGSMNHHKISGQNPVYPLKAKQAHVMGNVVVRVVISTKGDVIATRVLGGPPMLYESAVASIKTWKFRPLTWNGAPVEVELNEMVRYRLAG
jgi:TonB family protein